MTSRVGIGYDVHPFGGDGRLVLGGVTFDGPGLRGHSDGDVVAHAVADALLGAAGLGDIGTMFPASDDTWRGAHSVALLTIVAERVAAAGWFLANVDVAVAAEAPVLGPRVAEMVENLTGALVPLHEPLGRGLAVSVKPKRGEGIGFVGRREGIAAWAVALLDRG